MIKTRKELKFYIAEDLKPFRSKCKSIRFWGFATKNLNFLRMRFMIHLRKSEYYKNKEKRIYAFFRWFHQLKKNRIGNILNWEVPLNVCGYGLMLSHPNVVINSDSKIGNHVTFNGNNCVGRKGNTKLQNVSPTIGNDVVFGFGSCAVGNVKIGDNCVIGANAVVTKSFEHNGLTIVGNPAKPI